MVGYCLSRSRSMSGVPVQLAVAVAVGAAQRVPRRVAQASLQRGKIADHDARPDIGVRHADAHRVALPAQAGLDQFGVGLARGQLKVQAAGARGLDDVGILDESLFAEPLQQALAEPEDVRAGHGVGIDEDRTEAIAAERRRDAAGGTGQAWRGCSRPAGGSRNPRPWGWEMVSITATVSPKSLLICGLTGRPATDGRSVSDSRRPCKSCHTSSGFLTESNSSTKTTETFCRLCEWTFSTWPHCETRVSILRGDLLLDFFGVGAGVDRDDRGHADGNDRIVPLGHRPVRESAPQQRGDQRRPGHGTFIDEELGSRHSFTLRSLAASPARRARGPAGRRSGGKPR